MLVFIIHFKEIKECPYTRIELFFFPINYSTHRPPLVHLLCGSLCVCVFLFVEFIKMDIYRNACQFKLSAICVQRSEFV